MIGQAVTYHLGSDKYVGRITNTKVELFLLSLTMALKASRYIRKANPSLTELKLVLKIRTPTA